MDKAEIPNINPNSSEAIPVSSFNLPMSNFLSKETRDSLRRFEEQCRELSEVTEQMRPLEDNASVDEALAIRQCEAESFYASPLYTNLISRFGVSIHTELIGGVSAEVFAPTEGVSSDRQQYVLINLHGGGFVRGSGTYSRLESIPIAAVGKIKVISVDYRMSPEFQFPAANEDVIAVYRALLQHYQPENIGIYGCSAGGILTAQSLAWFQKEGLPPPAAVGMLCAASYYWNEGDSGYFAQNIVGYPVEGRCENRYFHSVDSNNLLAFPGKSSEILGAFPPSLLASSTRDMALSSVVYTHSQLIKLGVKADLHVWEGLDHAFFYNPDLPESREVFNVVVKFFNTHLGQH